MSYEHGVTEIARAAAQKPLLPPKAVSVPARVGSWFSGLSREAVRLRAEPHITREAQRAASHHQTPQCSWEAARHQLEPWW